RDATAPLEIARVDLGPKRPTTDPKLARPRPGMTTGLQALAATTRRGISFMLQETPPLQPGKKNAAQGGRSNADPAMRTARPSLFLRAVAPLSPTARAAPQAR